MMNNTMARRIGSVLKRIPYAGEILAGLYHSFSPGGLYWQYGLRAAKINKYVNKIKKQIKDKGYKLIIDAESEKQVVQLENGLKFNWIIKDTFSLLGMPLRGNFEPECTEILSGCLNPGDAGFDVGGNFGWYSCHMGRLVGEKGKIHSFEPTDIANDLRENVMINGLNNTVSIYRVALSDNAGKEKIYIPGKLGTAFASLKKHGEEYGEDYQVQEIETNTFDLFVKRNNVKRIDFIKMDIEGAELKALTGASESLAQFNPIIMLELRDDHCKYFGYSADDVAQYLQTFGYSLFEIEESGQKRLRRVTSINNAKNYNFLALKNKSALQGKVVFVD